MSQPSSRSSVCCSPSARGLLGWLLVLCAMSMVVLPGCSGCGGDDAELTEEERKQKEEEEKKKKEEEQRPPFEKNLMKVMPYDETNFAPGIKQGHWVTVSQGIKSNDGDFNGSLQFTPIDKRGVPIDLEDTPFTISLSRPVNLPKEQVKQLDMTLYAPPTSGNTRMRGGLMSQVGREVEPAIEEFRPLAPHEYFFVVLSNRPDRYSHLQVMHWSRAPSGTSMQEETFYHVVRPDLQTSVPLPESMLTWTGVAYVLWDDIDPNLLSLEQQRAMLDWLHWGGQLIVSGPESLDSLRGSFLSPYLPVEGGESIELTADDLSELSREFAPKRKDNVDKPLPAPRPWSAVELEPTRVDRHDILIESPGGKPLVVEKRCGRGRTVVTAFRLTQSELINWAGYDGFFNACLLRRGPREYVLRQGAFNQVSLEWQDAPRGERTDPRHVTEMRLFSRDAGYSYKAPEYDPSVMSGPSYDSSTLGAWTDFSDVANAARDTLTEAAGIEIPNAKFVVRVVLIYLLLVVPVNWLFFKLIGRVEWAWVAALVIALGYSVLVVRLAQLDIGFARSKTELAVLELQPGYDRAHLTRYTALYTSLSSDYDLEFADRHAVAQPFAIERNLVRETGDASREVRYRQDKGAELNDVPVQSNRTGLIHSEQMLPLDGAFEYTPGVAESIAHSVQNGTSRDLKNAVLVAKTNDERLRVGWLGELPAGGTQTAEMEPRKISELLSWYQDQIATDDATVQAAVRLNLIRLVDVCMRSGDFEPGDVRLVGTLDDPDQHGLSGVELSPSSPQARYGSVLIAHLQYASLPEPRRDANAYADYADEDGTVAPAFDGSAEGPFPVPGINP